MDLTEQELSKKIAELSRQADALDAELKPYKGSDIPPYLQRFLERELNFDVQREKAEYERFSTEKEFELAAVKKERAKLGEQLGTLMEEAAFLKLCQDKQIAFTGHVESFKGGKVRLKCPKCNTRSEENFKDTPAFQQVLAADAAAYRYLVGGSFNRLSPTLIGGIRCRKCGYRLDLRIVRQNWR